MQVIVEKLIWFFPTLTWLLFLWWLRNMAEFVVLDTAHDARCHVSYVTAYLTASVSLDTHCHKQ